MKMGSWGIKIRSRKGARIVGVYGVEDGLADLCEALLVREDPGQVIFGTLVIHLNL